MNINGQQLKTLAEKLAQYGRNEHGGLTRLSYSPEYKSALEFLQTYMHNIGMTTQLDEVGNLIGTYPGQTTSGAVSCGSHLDTVPNGGAFDGALGIVTALECMRTWHENNWTPLRSVKIIAFVEEEGSSFGSVCFGSRAMVGSLAGEDPSNFTGTNGTLPTLAQAFGLKKLSFPTKFSGLEDYCFIELHIEQGKFLEKAKCPLGIVSAIVGIKRLSIHIQGAPNHSGTTAMPDRQDALVAASALISELYQQALNSQGRYVATVGKINITPNAENVVPGTAALTVEIRAEQTTTLEEVQQAIQLKISELEKVYRVQIKIISAYDIPPVAMSPSLIEVIKEASEQLNIPNLLLPSWAGHDAMIMAKKLPTAMIFVPSANGISHSPEENSSWSDIEQATNILNKTLIKLASTPKD